MSVLCHIGERTLNVGAWEDNSQEDLELQIVQSMPEMGKRHERFEGQHRGKSGGQQAATTSLI